MGSELPILQGRTAGGWSAPVLSLVGSRVYGDDGMTEMVTAALDDDNLRQVAVDLAGFVAVLLAASEWGDGCTSHVDLMERWERSSARMVGRIEQGDV